MTLGKSNHSSEQGDLNWQLAQLDQKLISYRVVDRQGTLRAIVSAIYYTTDKSLNLLVKLKESDNSLNLHILEHTYIRQLDLDNKLIFTNLSFQEIANLPLYSSVPPGFPDTSGDSSLSNEPTTEIRETHNFSLLEEKLTVDRYKRKLGEVIVSKQVDTKMVQVAVRQEKLIIERIGEHPEQLAEVVIGSGKVNGFEYERLNDTDTLHTTKSHFLEVETAQKLLEAITYLSSADNAKVRLEIVTNCSKEQIKHQDICARFSR